MHCSTWIAGHGAAAAAMDVRRTSYDGHRRMTDQEEPTPLAGRSTLELLARCEERTPENRQCGSTGCCIEQTLKTDGMIAAIGCRRSGSSSSVRSSRGYGRSQTYETRYGGR